MVLYNLQEFTATPNPPLIIFVTIDIDDEINDASYAVPNSEPVIY